MKVVLLARLAPDSTLGPVAPAHVLHDPSSATTLRRRGAGLELTDGPAEDVDEPVAGLEELDVADFGEAVARAASLSAARTGAVEVRRVDEGHDDPAPAGTPSDAGRHYVFLHVLPSEQDGVRASGDGPLSDWLAAPLTRRTVLGGERLLKPTPETAAVVRVRGGEAEVGRGLPAGARDEVAGYDLVDALDLDEAIAVARPHPTLTRGAIEIRPLVGP